MINEKELGTIRTIQMWQKSYRIRMVNLKPEVWDFVDIPTLAIFNYKGQGSTYKGSHIEEVVLGMIKPELEKALGRKVKRFTLLSKEELHGKLDFYSKENFDDNRIKYYEGKPFSYWQRTPDRSLNRHYYYFDQTTGQLVYDKDYAMFCDESGFYDCGQAVYVEALGVAPRFQIK